MNVNVYEGRFSYEKLLFRTNEIDGEFIIPCKGDFIFYGENVYKVLYGMVDVHNDEYSIFVRKAIEEDY